MAVREFGFYVKGEAADAGFLGASEAGFVVEDDRVFVDAPEVGVVGVSNGLGSLVFPVDSCRDIRGEYGARNGMVVGCPVGSTSGECVGPVVADGAGVQM
jgi:hypothetical protein